MIYVTADTHFDHGALLTASDDCRGFNNIEEMNNLIIKNWNSIVGDKDEVYILGDFCLSTNKKKFIERLTSLNGKKHLVIGNHDHKHVRNSHIWESVEHLKTLKYTDVNGIKRKIIMCHYPIYDWQDCSFGSIHLHGHCHGGLDNDFFHQNYRIFDCCIASNDFFPHSIDTVIEKMRTKNKKSHHGKIKG